MARTFTYRCCPVCHSTMRSAKFCLDVGTRTSKPTVEVDVNFARRRITFEGYRLPDECKDGTPPHECRPPYSRRDWLESLKVAVARAAAALGLLSEKRVKQAEREVFPEQHARKHNEMAPALFGVLQEHAKRKKRKLTRGVGRPGRARGLRVQDGATQRFNFIMPRREERARGLRVADGSMGRVSLLMPKQAAREVQAAKVADAVVADGGVGKVSWRG